MNPDTYTIAEHMLDVGDGHTLYIHDWGNPDAKKQIVFLHGGPGSTQCKDKHKLAFDPLRDRVVFFDQRGAGNSTPLGKWQHNTTQDISNDIIRVTDFLGAKTYIVTGESWGSTLALFHAIEHPNRVEAIVTGGVLTGSQTEIDWLDRGMFQSHFPEAWAHYLASTPPEHRSDPTAYHFAQATGKDAGAAKQAAYTYEQLEASLIQLDDTLTPEPYETYDPRGMQIEMRYLANGLFLPEDYILKNAHKLTMPIYIVQGRYDFVCPPHAAYTLSQKAPNTELIYTIAGHKNEHENLVAKRLIFARLAS